MTVLKIEPSEYMKSLLEHVGKTMGQAPTVALKSLLYRIELMAKHGKLDENFGLDWMDAASILNGIGGSTEIAFDLKLLETTKRGRTGFVGVYVTGSAFRALVPDPERGNTSRYLKSHPTAVLAAIERYEWFTKRGIPYGNIGLFVAERQERNPERSVIDCLVEAREYINVGLKYPFTQEQLEATIRAHRETNGLPDDYEPSPPRRDQEPVADQQPACGVCKDLIAENQRPTFYGTGMDVAHSWCLDLDGKPLESAKR